MAAWTVMNMICENIKKARKEQGLSQEELAVKLHVVRQTVSKWEKGLSVPDADVLIRIAELLQVPVSQLLGLERQNDTDRDLAGELAKINKELAAKNQKLKQTAKAGEKRGLILFLSFVSMTVALSVKNELVSLTLTTLCILAALIILYRNLALLTSLTTDDLKLGALRLTTVFNMLFLVTVVLIIALDRAGVLRLSEDGEKLLAVGVVCAAMVFFGFISPKLPFSRHTGLRLPWTVRDEETWNVAHRVLGIISLPLALLFIAAALTVSDLGAVIVAAVFIWVGIPGLISGLFFWRKFHG